MFGKAGYSETAKLCACRGPDGMAKPGLVEIQSPRTVNRYGADTAADICGPLRGWRPLHHP